ncbi:MAG: SDR family oxidoreductase [Actinobacteria bacterium]|nr:SDR family oxidoreductase [Actinomycetota bacterium]
MPTAVVTGASRGLGRGIAAALAEAGFDVVIGWCRSEVDAKDTATVVEATGRAAVLVGGDVTDPTTHRGLAAAAVAELGGLDVWVNNAGVSMLAPVVDTSTDDLRRMLETNVIGVHLGMKEAVGRFRSAGRGGRIVNVASELGVQAFPFLGAYAASKFAVVGLTQAAAIELASEGITVNAVGPGTAETDMVMAERASESALTGRSHEEVRAAYLGGVPTGRFCTPADVGALVAYLASPAASYVTGQTICINGGSVLH